MKAYDLILWKYETAHRVEGFIVDLKDGGSLQEILGKDVRLEEVDGGLHLSTEAVRQYREHAGTEATLSINLCDIELYRTGTQFYGGDNRLHTDKRHVIAESAGQALSTIECEPTAGGKEWSVKGEGSVRITGRAAQSLPEVNDAPKRTEERMVVIKSRGPDSRTLTGLTLT